MRRQTRPGYRGRINRQHIHGEECSETEHQQALIDWARDTAALQDDEMKRDALLWLHAIPNGGGRGKPFITRRGARLPPLQAVQMKAEGVVAGINDLRLDYVVRETTSGSITSPGLVAEMKEKGERLRPEQRDYQQFMLKQGFPCYTWFTWQEGAAAISHYMHLDIIAPVYVQEGNTLKIIKRSSQL
jgi:hypothetical protein